jgi:diguanylate cyclase (GGDEF)-like protein/PAS domain S-box-containing protein
VDANEARRWRGSWPLRATLAALALALAGLIAVTVRFATETERTLQQVSRQAGLSLRLRALQGVLVALLDAETGQRGYLLTDDERYLDPYRAAVGRLPAMLAALDDGIGPADPAAARRSDELHRLIGAKLAEMGETVRLQAGGRHDRALALMLSDRGRDLMVRVRATIGEQLEAARTDRDRIGADIGAGVVRIRRLLVLAVGSLLLFVALAIGQLAHAMAVRRRYAQALARSEQRHRALVEDQSELVSLAREDGTLVYVNPAFARHFGREPADMVGMDRCELLAAAGRRDALRQELADVLRSGRERRSEDRIVDAAGRERWISWMNKRCDEPGGALLYSVGRDVTERKRAERALRASRAFLHRTGRIAGVGGWEMDLVGGEHVWSDEARRILEAEDDYAPTRAELVEGFAPEARATMAQALSDCIERGVPWDLELPRLTCKGRRIWVRTVASLEFENGRPRRIAGALQDITGRKELERRLADSEHFLRQITDSLPVRIAYLDTQARYRFVNWAHCKRFGTTRDEIIGRTRSEMNRGAADDVVAPRIAAVLRGEPQRFEYDDAVGGQVRRIDCNLLPDVGEDGRVRGFYATGIDITDRVASERRLRELTQILELTPDFIVQADRRGRLEYVNPALRRALGIAADAPLGRWSMADFVTPQTAGRYAAEIRPALRTRGAWLGEATLQLASGVAPVSHLVIAHRGADGRVEHLSAVMRDISGEVAARDALALQTAALQSVVETLPAMVAVVDGDERYRLVNSAFERAARLPRERILGRRIRELVSPEEYERRRPWIERALKGEMVSFETYDEHRRLRHLSLSYTPLCIGAQPDGFVGMALDITSQKEEAGRLLALSQSDAHTGLLNRAGLQAWLEQRARAEGLGQVALLYIDLDHFKPVNDTFGHPAGDDVLRLFALRLRELVRPADAVARLGGDEFALALAGVREPAHARAVAAKVVEAAAQPFAVGGVEVSIGASVGVAFQVEGVDDAQALIAHADAMLYAAKAAGRNTFA